MLWKKNCKKKKEARVHSRGRNKIEKMISTVRRSFAKPALLCRRQFSIFQKQNTIAETRAKWYSNPAVGMKRILSKIYFPFRHANFLIYLFHCLSHSGADNPTYLKENGDTIVVGAMGVCLASGLSMILFGLYSMSNGINKL